MYRAYQVNLDEINSLTTLYDSSYISLETKDLKNLKNLKNYVNQNGLLDMNAIQEDWFPNLQGYDVFLSHSHADEKEVLKFANYLKETFDLKCFVDSQLWKYSLDLLRVIDNKYCQNSDGKTYNYHLRNQSTAHIHMMLATALIQMIHRCKCFIFLKSSNSIYQNKNDNFCTHSTWINLELFTVQIFQEIQSKILFENASSMEAHKEIIQTEYELSLDNLPIITPEEFMLGQNNDLKGQEFLDFLSNNIGR